MKRTSLPLPVKSELREGASSRAVERMWSHVEARTARGRSSAPRMGRWLAVTVMLVAGGAFAAYGVGSSAHTVPAPAGSTVPLPETSRSARPLSSAASPVEAPAPRALPALAPLASVGSTAPVLPTSKPVATPAPPTLWRELESSGDHTGAYTQLGPDGFAAATRSATIDELFALADVARLSGHPRDARLPLGRIVDEYASDPRAPLAALTLGRVELTSLGMPGPAASSLEKAIVLGLPAGLAGDAYVLLADAYTRVGDRAAMRRTYDAYVARFPNGDKESVLRAKLSSL